MIWKNFVRDLRRTASRLISVSIITMIAVMVYTALSGILTNIERIPASYLEGQNVADYWLTGVNLDQGDCRTLEGIAGVTGVQPRVVLDAEERHDSSVTLQLYAVPGDYAINTPYVVEGRLPESSSAAPSPVRWPRIPMSCSATNPLGRWTTKPERLFWPCCTICAKRAGRPWWWSPTTGRWRRRRTCSFG